MLNKINNDSTRSKMRSKSTRKPLRDLSNSKTAIKSLSIYKNNQKQGQEEENINNAQDCLLLVHSDISSLLRQIDELVVLALQSTSKKGRKEIKQFADVLTEMHTSLKPWVPRIQKALSNPTMQTEIKSEQPNEAKSLVCVPEESADFVIESPEKTKWESLISPSPLVSWPAESKTEGVRQHFLLTPLHKTRPFTAERQVSSVPANEKITPDKTLQPFSNLNDYLSGVVSTTNSTHNKAFNLQVTETTTDFEKDYESPAKFSNCSKLVLMTPGFKFSPPKSCAFLEPLSEITKKKNPGTHKSTPFPTRTQYSGDSLDSESSSHETDDDFNMKYPELFGIKLGHGMGISKKVLEEESPGWDISPPITCTIMEPVDEITLSNLPAKCSPPKTITAHNQQADVSLANNPDHQQGIVESTPMIKEPASCFRVGKHPGENTLKRELWVQFEAATTPRGIRFNDATAHKTSKKGFLDKLDEASDAQWS